MRLEAHKYVMDRVALSFEAETQAEIFQMKALIETLKKSGADAKEWNDMEWNDMEGSSGWTVQVRCVE